MLLRDFSRPMGTLFGPQNCRSTSLKEIQENRYYAFLKSTKACNHEIESECINSLEIHARLSPNCALSTFARGFSGMIKQ
jgi:hypothetical protein